MFTVANTFLSHPDTCTLLTNLSVSWLKPGLLSSCWLVGILGLSIWHLDTPFYKRKRQSLTATHYDELVEQCNRLEVQLSQLLCEKDNLAQELELRSRELTTQTLNLLQKNVLMEEVREMIAELLKTSSTSLHPGGVSYSRLIKLIDYSFSLDKEWEDFKIYFEQVHQSFFVRLKEICPDLTPGELRLCALVKLNLNLKESATILKISPDSVKTARYRLRKKLNIPEEQTLTDFLLTI